MDLDQNLANDNPGCEMCSNYEISLQALQTERETLSEQLAAAKELYEKYGKELSEERIYRKELEGKFAVLNERTEQRIQECFGSLTNFDERISLLGKKQEADLKICMEDLDIAQNRYKDIQKDLVKMNEKYQRLLGVNAQCAEEMREQQIELPQTIEELQFLALQLRENLISERASREHETRELRDDLTVLREQLLDLEIRDNENEGLMNHNAQQQHIRTQQNRDWQSSQAIDYSTATTTEFRQECVNCEPLVGDLKIRLSHTINRCARVEEMLKECQQRYAQLQMELDTSEAVQKDFVRLSQQLQIELEKVRQAEIEVRWQEPEDVNQCNGCKKFIEDNSQSNCKHCGKIFCSSCLSFKVSSGPSRRQVFVCSFCHSLLSKDHSLIGGSVEKKN